MVSAITKAQGYEEVSKERSGRSVSYGVLKACLVIYQKIKSLMLVLNIEAPAPAHNTARMHILMAKQIKKIGEIDDL